MILTTNSYYFPTEY